MSDLDPIYGRFSRDRSNLLPLLRMIQQSEKYIPAEAVLKISLFMDISRNDVYSVITFYPFFRLAPPELKNQRPPEVTDNRQMEFN